MRTSRATGAQKVRPAHALAYRGTGRGKWARGKGAKRDVLQWTEPKTGVHARGKDKWPSAWKAAIEFPRVFRFSHEKRAFLLDLLQSRTWTFGAHEDELFVPLFFFFSDVLPRHLMYGYSMLLKNWLAPINYRSWCVFDSAIDRCGLHRISRWWIVDWQRRAVGLKGKWGLGASRGRIMTGRPRVARMVRAGTSSAFASDTAMWPSGDADGLIITGTSFVCVAAGSVENEDSPYQVKARSCLLSANGM